MATRQVTIHQVDSRLREISESLRRQSGAAPLGPVYDVLGVACTLLQKSHARMERRHMAPAELRTHLLRLGPLDIAEWIEESRLAGFLDSEIAQLLSFKSTRRLRHLVALLRLPKEAQDVIRSEKLTERQVRPLVPWQKCAHLTDLLKTLARRRLTAQRVSDWAKLIRPPAQCTSPTTDLTHALAQLDKILS